jgi:hypothetical protein
MTGTSATLMSLLMIAGFVLVGGGIFVTAKPGLYKTARWRGPLMIVAGLVMWGNVAIMTL